MARAMFEYTKTVLSKVSFDPVLFCKELQKAVTRLLPHEIEEITPLATSIYARKTRANPLFSVY